jgi:hypothetical protein
MTQNTSRTPFFGSWRKTKAAPRRQDQGRVHFRDADGPGSPYAKNNKSYEEAVEAAKAEGIMVLDGTKTYCLVEHGYYLPDDPENPEKLHFGNPRIRAYTQRMFVAPASYRTVAEEYWINSSSWSISVRGA